MPTREPPHLDRPNYLSGADRERYAAYVHHLYSRDRMTVRQIARHTERGYATIHKLLEEHETHMRPQGHPMGVAMRKRTRDQEVLVGELQVKRPDGSWETIQDDRSDS